MVNEKLLVYYTDEQVEKGYTQSCQEEMLCKYCQFQGVLIRKVIFEDHSAP